MKIDLIVVKIGGNLIANDSNLKKFLKDYSKIKEKKILVHGGGSILSILAQKQGVNSKVIDGRRITDKNTLELALMTYGGLLNKKIVSILQKYDCNSLGLSGPDGNLILAEKRKKKGINYGFVGDIKKINTLFLDQLINLKISPVICSLSHNKRGQILNTNADTIASTISIKMSKKYNIKLLYCLDKPGLLMEDMNDKTVITKLTGIQYQNLIKRKIIKKGMIPKIACCYKALKGGVNEVYVGNRQILMDTTNCTKVIM